MQAVGRAVSGWLIVIALTSSAAAQDEERSAADFFESRVRPLLAENCFQCHGPDKQEGGLRLDSRAGVLAGGDSGAAAVEGHPEESLLVEAIEYRSLEMPPDNRLGDEQVATLRSWVERGLPWPNSDDTAIPQRAAGLEITDEDRQHWSFLPIRRGAVPNDPNSVWDDSNPVDGFILAKLVDHGLQPSPPASRRELLRRVYFDLIGLPPSPAEMARFIADESPDAFARVVDELLARPQYGERWGRHWLDLVRFAQTNGYERDDEKPYVWRYRDYVIRSFNDDKPYDRFVLEQLAGDELDEVHRDSIIATGYYHLGVWDDEPDDKIQARYDALDDVLRATGETFLALTIGCARCHDHKFDPIPQSDYYRLLALIENIAPYGKDKSATHWELNPDAVFTPLASVEQIESWKHQEEELKARIEELRKSPGETDEEKKERKERLAELEKQLNNPPYERALSVRENQSASPTTNILIRGSHLTPGPEVTPALLTVLGGDRVPITPLQFEKDADPLRAAMRYAGVAPTSGRRRALAGWIVDPANPLTARVIVNRVWQHHFGRGLVATPNDFGRTGEHPSHPELLDWLAVELIEGQWSLKRLHRLMLLSNTYQQSSHARDVLPDEDPDNRLLWRQNLQRLEAETLRDAVLWSSGELNYEMGGRGFFPVLAEEVLASQSQPGKGWDDSPASQRARRSVYIYLKRTLGVPILEVFDAPVFDVPEPERQATTIAPQALTLLNGAFVQEQSTALAERLMREVAGDDGDWTERLFQLALARSPTTEERETLLAFWQRRRAAWDAAGQEGTDSCKQALADCCRLVFNLNEFLYID